MSNDNDIEIKRARTEFLQKVMAAVAEKPTADFLFSRVEFVGDDADVRLLAIACTDALVVAAANMCERAIEGLVRVGAETCPYYSKMLDRVRQAQALLDFIDDDGIGQPVGTA